MLSRQKPWADLRRCSDAPLVAHAHAHDAPVPRFDHLACACKRTVHQFVMGR